VGLSLPQILLGGANILEVHDDPIGFLLLPTALIVGHQRETPVVRDSGEFNWKFRSIPMPSAAQFQAFSIPDQRTPADHRDRLRGGVHGRSLALLPRLAVVPPIAARPAKLGCTAAGCHELDAEPDFLRRKI